MPMQRSRLVRLRRRVPENQPAADPEPAPIVIPDISSEQLADFIANHNNQSQSPLFTYIPSEVRNTIFLYALLSYDDLGTLYPNNAHYCRPGYRYTARIDPRLLRTCRLIYLETRLLPMLVTGHVFWGHRAPPGIRLASNPDGYFKRLTEEQRNHVDRVHFFTQQYYLESDFIRACGNPDMRPKSMHVTLRHGDWWSWESNNRLNLKEGWTNGLGNQKRLEELILELETMERDKDQIYAIARSWASRKFKLNDGRVLSAEENPIIKQDWMGPSRWEGLGYNKELNQWIYGGRGYDVDSPDPGMKYCIAIVRWTAPPPQVAQK
ncbi:hypothetical protein C8J56DRAFT_938724 [Mycena floridula]|nr:hypothetical protein C8J56DRAFT_938724 [Mycena floridula]